MRNTRPRCIGDDLWVHARIGSCDKREVQRAAQVEQVGVESSFSRVTGPTDSKARNRLVQRRALLKRFHASADPTTCSSAMRKPATTWRCGALLNGEGVLTGLHQACARLLEQRAVSKFVFRCEDGIQLGHGARTIGHHGLDRARLEPLSAVAVVELEEFAA